MSSNDIFVNHSDKLFPKVSEIYIPSQNEEPVSNLTSIKHMKQF